MLKRWNFLKTGFYEGIKLLIIDELGFVPLSKPESTEGRPWGQPLKKLEGAPVNLG